MAIRYQLDSTDFTKDPLNKRWSRQSIATSGVGEPLYSDFWQVELSWGNMAIGDVAFFEGRWLAGGLHTAKLPHPKTGVMTGFTGVAILDVGYEFLDADSDGWAGGVRMQLGHINLAATGTV